MTKIKYRCEQHGLQPVDELILPGNVCILSCGCIYSANYHGNNYRIKTSYCDKCRDKIIYKCMITTHSSTRFYHVECAESLGITKLCKIVNIDDCPDHEVDGLNK